MVAIKGNPTTSLSRLIKGIQNAKSLNRLDDLIEERGKTLETLNAKINVAENILSVYEKNILKKLDAATDQGAEDIKTVCNSAKSEIFELGKRTMDQMNAIGASHTQKLDAIDKTAVGTLNQISKTALGITTYLDSETERVTNILRNNIFAITQQFIKDMGEYNKLRDEIRNQEILGKYGYYLLGVLNYPEEIKEVPLPIIA